jgi:hypothetical protein
VGHSTCHLLARWFAGLFFDPEDGGARFLRNVMLLHNGLHGVISQKMIFFNFKKVHALILLQLKVCYIIK